MTKSIHGSDVCKKKLRVNLSRLKVPVQVSLTDGLKTASKERCNRPTIPAIKLSGSPSPTRDIDITEKVQSCGSPCEAEHINSSGQKSVCAHPVHLDRTSSTLVLKKLPNPFIHEDRSFLSELAGNGKNRTYSLDGVESESSDEVVLVEQPSTRQSRRKHEEEAGESHWIQREEFSGQRRSSLAAGTTKSLEDSYDSSSLSKMKTRWSQPSKQVSYIRACKIVGRRKHLLLGNRLFKRSTLFSSCYTGDPLQFNNKPRSKFDKLSRKKLMNTLKAARRKETNTTVNHKWETKQESLLGGNSGENVSTKKHQRDKATSFGEKYLGRIELPTTDCVVLGEVAADAGNAKPEVSISQRLTEDSKQGSDKDNNVGCLQYSKEKNKTNSDDEKMQEDVISWRSKKKDSLGFHFGGMESKNPCVLGQRITKSESPLPYHNKMKELKASLKTMHRKQRKERREGCSATGFDSPDSGGHKLSLTLRPLSASNCQWTPSEGLSAPNKCNKQSTKTISVDAPKLPPKLTTGYLLVPSSVDSHPEDDGGNGGDCNIDNDGDHNGANNGNMADGGDDDDVIIESIKTPRALKRGQITSCISDLFESSKTFIEAPTLEYVNQKLKSIFGDKIAPWKRYVEEQYKIMAASASLPSSEHVQQDGGLVTVGKYAISGSDLSSLDDDAWLNDNIINAYFQLVAERSPLKVFAVSSFFYQVYCRKGFDHVQRWHRKVDLFSYQIILIPIHSRHHWCLVAVNLDEYRITFYDSMRKKGSSYLTTTERYMREEANARGVTPRVWELKSSFGIPQQRNYSDCGVFVCQFAKRLSVGKHVIFSHREAADFRRMMKRELLSKHLEK